MIVIRDNNIWLRYWDAETKEEKDILLKDKNGYTEYGQKLIDKENEERRKLRKENDTGNG